MGLCCSASFLLGKRRLLIWLRMPHDDPHNLCFEVVRVARDAPGPLPKARLQTFSNVAIVAHSGF